MPGWNIVVQGMHSMVVRDACVPCIRVQQALHSSTRGKRARGASTEVTEEHLSSCQSKSSLLLCSCIRCSECGKPRCIYANEHLAAAEERTLQHIKAATWKLSWGGTTHYLSGHLLCI